MRRLPQHVRVVPNSEVTASFNYFVGAEQKACRHLNAKRLGGSDVHNCLDLGYLFDRDVAGLCTLKNLVHENRSTAKHFGKIHAIGHESAAYSQFQRSN